MSRRNILGALCLAVVALAAVQHLAISLAGSPEISWYFTPSHVIGGMCIAFATLYAAYGFAMRPTLVQVLAVVLAVGLAWEVLEYVAGANMTTIDTVSDIIADLLGGALAYRIVRTSQ